MTSLAVTAGENARQGQAGPRRAACPVGALIEDLLGSLSIRARDLCVSPCPGGWCVTMDCRVGGSWQGVLLELTREAVSAGEQGGADRDTLTAALDEYLADCDRLPRQVPRQAGARHSGSAPP